MNGSICTGKMNGSYIYGREERLRYLRAKRRRERIIKKRLVLAGMLLFLFVSLTVLSGFAFPGDEGAMYRYYTSVTVDRGETLGEIASRYYDNANKSKRKYLLEIMELNNMNSTRIYAGQTLIIPYYSDIDK